MEKKDVIFEIKMDRAVRLKNFWFVLFCLFFSFGFIGFLISFGSVLSNRDSQLAANFLASSLFLMFGSIIPRVIDCSYQDYIDELKKKFKK